MLKSFEAPIYGILVRKDESELPVFVSGGFQPLVLDQRILVDVPIFPTGIHPTLDSIIIGVAIRIPTFLMAVLGDKDIVFFCQFRVGCGLDLPLP